MSATYCRFTMIARVLTVPKMITYVKHTIGTEELLCSFIAGVAPRQDEKERAKTRYLECFNVQAFGGIGKIAFNNLSVGDYIFVEGTPRSEKKNYGKDLSKCMFYSNFTADKIILLNRKINRNFVQSIKKGESF